MQHAVVAHSLKRRGMSNGTVARILQELYDLQGILTVPGAGDTKPFPYTLGGKQGAVETPDVFNLVVEDVMEPVVRKWSKEGWGARLYDGHVISHAIWSDNIYIFASSAQEFRTMLEDLTDAFACHGFTWKADSLEYMALGTDGDAATLIIKHREVTYTYQKVTQMIVLGVLLDSKGSTDVSVDHRLAIADNCVRSSMQVLKGPGGITAKLRAWSTAPAATAAFGCSTWHNTKDLLRRAQRWEYHWLRKVFSCRRKSDEGFMQYNVKNGSSHRSVVLRDRRASALPACHQNRLQGSLEGKLCYGWRLRQAAGMDT